MHIYTRDLPQGRFAIARKAWLFVSGAPAAALWA